MRLRVLSVGYPFAPVAENTAGGAEQVLAMLDLALSEAGHLSTVLAPAGSQVRGELIPFSRPPAVLKDDVQRQVRARYRDFLAETLARHSFDLVHMHGVDFLDYLPEDCIPVLVTLHLPPESYPAEAFTLQRSGIHLVCVSESQRKRCPRGARIAAVVENGISISGFSLSMQKGEYVLGLGRICPEKGFHFAMDAASVCGLPFVLAGNVYDYPAHRAYFRECIEPRLRNRHRFVGQVDLARKRSLLAEARCLLVPSLVPETSSLVAMEALACGTPVIAFRAGALPEIIDHGRTGFIVDSVSEMTEAIRQVSNIDPFECRREAEERFSADTMTQKYFELYERILTREVAAQATHDVYVRSSRELQTRVLADLADVQQILPDWDGLWNRCPRATTFQRSEWLFPWMEVFWPSQPLVIEVRDGDRLVGFAPLLVYTKAGTRILALMGGGVSDYLDILVDPNMSSRVLAAMWGVIEDRRSEWDEIEFTDLHPCSSLLQNLPAGWDVSTGPHDACPVLDLPPSVNALRDVVPAHQLRNLRNARARLRKVGDGQLEIATSDTLDDLLDAVLWLHERRWSQVAGGGVLDDARVQAFHRRAAPRLLEQGVLRLYGLRVNGQYIAALYALLDRGIAYYYLQGFDPDAKWFSPGTQILGAVIEDAVRSGARQINMLRGRETYKYQWGAHDEPTYCLAGRVKTAQPAESHLAA